MPKQAGNMPKRSGKTPKRSGERPKRSGETPKRSAQPLKRTAEATKQSDETLIHSEEAAQKRTPFIGKIIDFLLYTIIVLLILSVATLWLSSVEALVAAIVIFCLSAGTIIHVSFSSSQLKMIKSSSYYQINYKLFSPFALVISFPVICYLLNGIEPQFFIGSSGASIVDFLAFGFDNIIRVVFWDIPEIFGLSATGISHNVDNLVISTFILLFRTLIGLSLLKMLLLYLRN